MELLPIAVAFVAAAWLRLRGKRLVVVLPLAALIVPLAFVLYLIVHWGDMAATMYWPFALAISPLYGLVAAGFGCGAVALVQRVRGA
jgi:hypothetical protein